MPVKTDAVTLGAVVMATFIAVSPEQPAKARSPTVVMVLGRVMLCRLVQFSKAPSPTPVTV